MNYTDGYTRTCGLIGNPVKHTMSPLIHNSLASMTGINMVYVPFEVKEKELKNAIKGAVALDIQGMNVTIPYKTDVIPFLEDVDPLAKAIGAVNTLVRTANGGFKGYNTDMTGLYHAMQDEGIELKDQTVVILGAGGVARPTAFLCANKGAKKVYILNRTFEKAVDVADEVNLALELTDSDEKVVPMLLGDYRKVLETEDSFIAIQCTSVGLFPDVNSAVIEDEEFYKKVSSAMDLVYRPLQTKFLKLAKEAGAKTFSGLKMLLYQGIDAYELWNEDKGIKISKEQADEIYKSMMLEVVGASNIVLEGFMGSGKSTVSELLSEKLMLELIDTDEVIEDTEGRTINEIFETEGEASFREMETDLLEAIDSDHWREFVISLGGGMPVKEENRELLRKIGKVVYLRAKPETIFERVKDDDKRPLLKTEDPLAKIEELLEKRASFYEDVADVIIDTDGKTPLEITKEIIDKLGL
ncbi:shikimate dehydrogenase [Butyrivibrio sp. Su6]|uniref:shikimate dehydrogenase n=1 Tax=unclassified Butyrivibrio TaxID=2639466 RepID=UPI00089F2917|nr:MULTISPECIES: shikimate dehydrogenase [unclassified Butyrivibrio]MBQ9302945.1 shikimate dehydrogenase [Butyrivibrio sp.]SEF98765.1 shikimate dehydrogenase [Butyrivibrio sp. Su6]